MDRENDKIVATNQLIRFSTIFRIISVVLLIVAIPELPYGYYVFLRWVVCASSGFTAFVSSKLEKRFWMILYGLIAILFNPIVPIYLEKEIWVVIDIIIAIVIGISLFTVKRIKEDQE